uniref:M55 family metallopeptidase n=1 Tax=uncultured Draconibacterium sp. TaxID=1573823 RepID=UPI003217E143
MKKELNRKSKVRSLKYVLLLLISAVLLSFKSSAQKKIYIVTDLEGISGIYRWKQVKPKDTPIYKQACEFFMADLSAVIRGLKDGGATEIVVLDGHGPQAVLPELMEPGVRYITGTPRPKPLYGLDESFEGIVQVGAHAMRGTPDGVLHHTQSSSGRFRLWYNGVETGEIGMVALMGGYFKVPVIMVSGDVAACREANKFLGNNVTTVVVKEGIAEESAVLYPFDETRQALYEGAKKAMTNIGNCEIYSIDMPFDARIELTKPDEKHKKVWIKTGTYPSALHTYDIVSEKSEKR